MKKSILAIVIVAAFVCVASSQGINITFIPEGVQTVTENTELLLSDPTINQTIFFMPPTFDQKKESAAGGESADISFSGFSVGIESEISGPNKSITLPLSYTWKKLNFGASIPYIIKRKMRYSQESVETSGVGDISANVAYSGGGGTFNYSAGIFAKFPTGDDEKMVDGYLVPLGTGSLDIVFNLSMMKTFDKFSVAGSGIYRMNGASQKLTEVFYLADSIETIDYNITNGNMISITGRFDYFLNSKVTVGSACAFTTVAEGETDSDHSFSWDESGYSVSGISNKQDMTLLDVVPMISYRVFSANLTLMAKIPLMTERNEANREGDRDMTILFKLSRTL